MRTPRALIAGIVTVVLALGALVAPPAHATTQTDFIRSLVSAAQATQRERGIPASVTIGMAALETGWGRSSMAKDPINTLFNIKCTATPSPYQKGCVDVPSYEYRSDGTRYLKVSSFRSYANTGDSLKDFGLFLTKLSRYAGAFNHKDDPDAFVREVHRAGYATDPRYTELVTGIMRNYNLYQYDLPGSTAPAPGVGGSTLPTASGEYKSLTWGNANPHVGTLQRLLNDRMGRRIPVDGKYGWQTQAAVADFQYQTMKLAKQTGDVDRATWVALVPTLSQGASGAKVVALQHELRAAGYGSLTVDGIFGAQTRGAVEDFQRRHGLPVTGTVATMTWGRLLGL